MKVLLRFRRNQSAKGGRSITGLVNMKNTFGSGVDYDAAMIVISLQMSPASRGIKRQISRHQPGHADFQIGI